MTKLRLHPQSWNELRQLVRLHGLKDIRAALDIIAGEETGTKDGLAALSHLPKVREREKKARSE
jgi:hypothetical protein